MLHLSRIKYHIKYHIFLISPTLGIAIATYLQGKSNRKRRGAARSAAPHRLRFMSAI
jgi:hypothetical protein